MHAVCNSGPNKPHKKGSKLLHVFHSSAWEHMTSAPGRHFSLLAVWHHWVGCLACLPCTYFRSTMASDASLTKRKKSSGVYCMAPGCTNGFYRKKKLCISPGFPWLMKVIWGSGFRPWKEKKCWERRSQLFTTILISNEEYIFMSLCFVDKLLEIEVNISYQ